MLRAVLKKSWKTTPYKTAAVRSFTSNLTNHPSKANKTGWGSKNGIISNVLSWTTAHGHTSVVRPVKTYIHQLCTDTAYCGTCQDRYQRERERERLKKIRAVCTTWWRRGVSAWRNGWHAGLWSPSEFELQTCHYVSFQIQILRKGMSPLPPPIVLLCCLRLLTTPAASLQRGKTPTNEGPEHDTKQSDSEAPVMLELWGMLSISSLPLLPP